MQINSDFAAPVTVTPSDYRWVPSPQPGVERMMLDRVGGEVARATSLVRYAPNSSFPPHKHSGGEEIFVISGVFSDENGDYPAGWYLRNPPGSQHRPHSNPGALILVKLHQMHPDDQHTLRVDTGDPLNWHPKDGRNVCPVFVRGDERVFVTRLGRGDLLSTAADGGTELMVVSGCLSMDAQDYPAGSWIRVPAGTHPEISSVEPSKVFVKEGHVGAFLAPGKLI